MTAEGKGFSKSDVRRKAGQLFEIVTACNLQIAIDLDTRLGTKDFM
jgi:hypothetical protein